MLNRKIVKFEHGPCDKQEEKYVILTYLQNLFSLLFLKT